MLPYCGKVNNNDATERQSPADVVKRLSQHILGTGRNITIDRYYTGIELVEDLFNNHNTTVVGTINSNRQHVPEEMKSVKDRQVNSTTFAWSGPVMMLSYVPKAKKNVLLVSSQHDQPDVSQLSDRKPEVILAYNDDKGGVHIVDKMIDTYRTKVSTRRWPMVVFYTIVDIAALNSFVIWIQKNPNWEIRKSKERRRRFLQELGMTLVVPEVERCMETASGLSSKIQQAMQTILGKPSQPQPSTSLASVETAGRCNVCVSEKHGEGYKKAKYNTANKVKQRCDICRKPACKKHSKQTLVCFNCGGQ